MRAIVTTGQGTVTVTDVDEPVLLSSTDAIVRVERAGICGTDLHAAQAIGDPALPPGTVLGHEIVGVIETLGPDVGRFHTGDRVFSSDYSACGHCPACRASRHWHCPEKVFLGHGAVFGEPSPGGQAELVRIPFADVALHLLPESLDPDRALFATDSLATGYGAVRPVVVPGDVVAVLGGGAVGLMAAASAGALGAAAVVVVEPVAARRPFAEAVGALALDPAAATDVIQGLTDGLGPAVAVDAVGGHAVLDDAIALVRRAGTVVSVGIPPVGNWCCDAHALFDRELRIQFSIGDPIRWWPEIIPLLMGRRIDPLPLVTHRIGLDAVPEVYDGLGKQQGLKAIVDLAVR